MATISISDVLGKGFKYEQRIVTTLLSDNVTGTIGASVGVAHWGPIGKPTLIYKNFEPYFGTPPDKFAGADFAGLTVKDFLKYSPISWFTRITNGENEELMKASKAMGMAAAVAKLTGEAIVKNTSFIIFDSVDPNPNNLLSIVVNGIPVSVALSATPKADPLLSADLSLFTTYFGSSDQAQRDAANYKIGDFIEFMIDSYHARYVVKEETGAAADFTKLINAPTSFVPGTFTYFESLETGANISGVSYFGQQGFTPSTPASNTIGSGIDGIVTISTDLLGTENNGVFSISVALGVGNDIPMSAVFTDGPINHIILITLGTDGTGILDPVKNTATLVAAAITTLNGVSAIASGTGVDPLTIVEASKTLIGAVDGQRVASIRIRTYNQLSNNIASVLIQQSSDGITWYDIGTAVVLPTDVNAWNTITLSILSTMARVRVLANANLAVGNTWRIVESEFRNSSDVDIATIVNAIENGHTGINVSSLAFDNNIGTPDVSDNYITRWIAACKEYILTPLGVSVADQGVILTGDPLVQPNTKIKLSSITRGAASTIKVYSIPKLFTATPANPLVTISTNTPIASIISQINVVLQPAKAMAYINIAGFLEFATTETGTTKSLRIIDTTPSNSNAYLELGLDNLVNDPAVTGTDAIADNGIFKAIYAGEDGNTIQIEFTETQDGRMAAFYFRGDVVGNFFNYSLNVGDDSFFGTLIQKDASISKVVSYESPIGVVSISDFDLGIITLSGGRSGINAITDNKYTIALDEYKNVDLYNIDVIAVPGNVSEDVADKIQEVCEYRMDCFGIVDPPETVAGQNGTIYKMIDWHNGLRVERSKKLDSQYIVTYFPWLMIDVGESTKIVANKKQWVSPSVRVMGTIAQSDKLVQHQFSAPTGIRRGAIADVEALAVYLREDDKARLYADELGNAINPIVYTRTNGFFTDGQKDTRRSFDALSRLNTLRTALYIKKYVYGVAPNFFWSPLTKATQDELKAILEAMMKMLVEKSAIKDNFIVVCDSTINTTVIEAQRGLVASIEFESVVSIEKIKIVSTIRDKKVSVTFG